MKKYRFIPLLVASAVLISGCKKDDYIIQDNISAVIEGTIYNSVSQKSSEYKSPVDYRELYEGGFSFYFRADVTSGDRQYEIYITFSDDEPIQTGIQYQGVTSFISYYFKKNHNSAPEDKMLYQSTSGWIEFTEITDYSLSGEFELDYFRRPDIMPTYLEALGLDSYVSLRRGIFGPIRVSSKITKHLGGE